MAFSAKFIKKHTIQKNGHRSDRIVSVLAVGIVVCLVAMGFGIVPQVGKASPVIADEGWSDTFDDANGVELSYNVNISDGDVKLKGYRNNFEDEIMGGLPAGWSREISGGSGNRFIVTNHYYEPGQAIWLRVNDDASAFNQQKVYTEFVEYFMYFEFELTLHEISVETERQGYFYIEFFDDTHTEYHEVRYYWDDARSGTPSNSSSLTAVDLGYVLATGTDLGVKYFLFENISEDIDANPNIDLSSVLINISKLRYGFYADAGPGWDRWEQVYIDNIGFYNDNYGNLTSTTISLPVGYAWTALSISKTEPKANTFINVSILDGNTKESISGFEDITGLALDISSIDPIAHPTLRLYAGFSGTGNATPVLHDWSLSWADVMPPATPTGLAISNPYTGYSLILSWNSNNESDLAHYRIWYSVDNDTFIWLTNIPDGTISFFHYGLTIGVTYYYKIEAVDEHENYSPNTTVVNGTPDIDTDGDGIGNNCDEDDDNDGYSDNIEISEGSDTLNPSSHPPDLDGDFIPDSMDSDIDGDGYNNSIDRFDYDPNEWLDTDGDGIGNNADLDDDDDGYSDVMELNLGSDPLVDSSTPEDFDDDGIPDAADTDDDNDGTPDTADPFPLDPTEWTDSDGDGTGNNADNDDDNDGYTDAVEIAEGSDPLNPGSTPPDNDRDFIPDSTDPDDDNDGVPDVDDDLPFNPNEVEDTDNDGKGNNADTDDDNDGIPDANDDFPLDDSEWNDLDGDGIGDNTDNDIDGDGHNNTIDDFDYNPNEWIDTDGDGIGDNADMDDDDDGYYDVVDDFPLDDSEWNDLDGDGVGDNTDNDIDGDGYDNTIDDFDYNPNEWIDTDGDGIGNNADMDDDDDGYYDVIDDFPLDDSEWNDLDEDGIGDNTDDDIDGDAIINDADDFMTDPTEWEDTDNDGVGDNKDIDLDGDGTINFNDAFPYNSEEWDDLDGDGVGDNTDLDKDGDGISNENDAFPENANEWDDTDDNGIGNNADMDDDGDGHPDIKDEFPFDETEWSDLDDDGLGDNGDDDKDGDGVLNTADKFPTNKMEWNDSDNDGIGDNGDSDDDNDGHPDTNDDYPYDSSKWREPNELLPLIYILLTLIVVLILIGIILVFKLNKLQKSTTLKSSEQTLSQSSKEVLTTKEPVLKEELPAYPPKELDSKKSDEIKEMPKTNNEEQDLPLAPPPPPPE